MRRLSIKKQKGMTLLEVVVSMLVIGLGMSASIAMLQASMQNNIAAINRNNAMYLSEAIIDKMRMNKSVVEQYLYGDERGNVSIDPAEGPKKAKSSDGCKTCDSEGKKEAFVQASKDVNTWYEELQQKLPGAGFAIYNANNSSSSVSSVIKGRYAIKIIWPNQIDKSRIKNNSGASSHEDTDSLETIFTL